MGCPEEASAGIFDRYAEAGGNFVDTANFYAGGRSEEILGRLLNGRRDRCTCATRSRRSLR
jgi:aryl-alcohol dehydrogenase-like predicted oxidoreductase